MEEKFNYMEIPEPDYFSWEILIQRSQITQR